MTGMNQPEPQTQAYHTLIAGIESGAMKIPQFQRDFVWSREKSAGLLDSIFRGYPIGTFILWRTKEPLRVVRNIGGAELPSTPVGEYVNYVLDGQQRLTSLFAAIKGLAVQRPDGKTEDYGEIRVDLAAAGDAPLVVVGAEGRPEGSTVRVVDLVEKGFVFFGQFPSEHHALLEQCQSRLKSYLFSVILVKDAALDVATEIFTRINEGGKPLTPFEIMVAKTFDAARDFDLAEQTDNAIDELANVGYGTVPDVVLLQTVAVLLVKECGKKAILNLEKHAFINVWPHAVAAVRHAVDHFRTAYRIPASRLLPYPSLLVPFAYYFHHRPEPPTGDVATRLRDLFWRVSIGSRYSASLEARLAQDVRRVDQIIAGDLPRYDFPGAVTPDFIWENGGFGTSRAFIKAILCLLASREPVSFADGSKVVLGNEWLIQANSKNYHHFFPRAYLRKKDWQEWAANHIANITIVSAYENKVKFRDKAPSTYMRTIGEPGDAELARRMKTHLIDPDRYGVWDNDYEKFTDMRCKSIARELNKLILPQPADRELIGVNDQAGDVRERAENFE